ncbi:MAG TPA: aminotransferase class V-fold PLP-dependent enzyme [Chitinophagaceae bacterium]|nr:aminotransferase class V-fold PLP-dependent enzyme [Chitinophagaceae bacterium]
MEALLTHDEIQQLRDATKGCATLVHFNNAGASLPPDVVVDTAIEYLREEALNGGYETEDKYRDKLANVYTSIARLINASAGEVAVTENASAGWWTAFNGLSYAPGDEIITCEMEYVTNVLGFLQAKKLAGVKVTVIPNDVQGNFCIEQLEDAITPKTKLIAATYIGSTAGNVMPAAAIGEIARRHNILYLLDACQAIGHLPVDVQHIKCDMLAVTGRKYLRAPRGTGFLYVRKALQDTLNVSSMDGFSAPHVNSTGFCFRNDARRFELYEKNRALVLGLGCAVDYAITVGIERAWQRIQYLAALLRSRLQQLKGVVVHDRGGVLCGIVTFSVQGVNPLLVQSKLAAHRINVSVGKAHSTLYYMEKQGLENNVRASLHYYNTEDEIQLFCEVLTKITSAF